MPVQRRKSVYEQVVYTTHAYLGPAAERFVDRQVRNHLHKEPGNITERDLSLLMRWIRLAVSLLTDDSQIIEEYISRLEQLVQES